MFSTDPHMIPRPSGCELVRRAVVTGSRMTSYRMGQINAAGASSAPAMAAEKSERSKQRVYRSTWSCFRRKVHWQQDRCHRPFVQRPRGDTCVR